MISANFSPVAQQQNTVAFKGKPSDKEIIKLYRNLGEIKFEKYLNNPNIPKADKMKIVLKKNAAKVSEFFNESIAKEMLNKIKK